MSAIVTTHTDWIFSITADPPNWALWLPILVVAVVGFVIYKVLRNKKSN
jgi:hypothetical protein